MFQLKQQCLIKSYKGSRGTSEDAKHKANFVIEAENVQAADVAALFGVTAKDVPGLVDSFFQEMTAGGRRDKRYAAVPSMRSTYFAEGKHTIAFGDRRPDRVDWLGAITVSPLMDGKFDVTFRASIEEPLDSLCGLLNKNINRSIRVQLDCDPGFEFQFKGSSQAPVDKKQPDLLDEQNADANKKRADAVGAAIKADDKKKAATAKKSAPPKKAAAKKAATPKTAKARTGRN